MSTPALLELRRVVVAGRDRPRLAGIDLALQSGERVALLGPSGAGKSTLLAVANGLLPPDQGTVLWQGDAPARSSRLRRRQQRRIGTLWQDLRLIEELTVQQ
ncbi:MAG: ATP-binding cassette domain-containing protein, partial [Prochlorococcaceae cyanobacterium]